MSDTNNYNNYIDPTDIELFPIGKSFRILFDNTVGKLRIISKKQDDFEEIRDHFSSPNTNAFFIQQFGYKTESKLYVINKFGYFQSGLIFDILNWIKDNYGSLNCVVMSENCKNFIVDNITPLKSFVQSNKEIQISNISDDLGRNNELIQNGKHPYEYRDYQLNSVKYLLTKGYGRGLIEIPTAGGKSFILANFIWNYWKNIDRNSKTLILVPNKQLVEQFYKDLIDYGLDMHLLTRFTAGLKKSEAFNPNAKIIIANRQYVFKNEQKLPNIDMLICDEVHQCLSSATQNFIEHLHCRIKIGCSGTLPRDKNSRWQLIGLFGRIVYIEDIVKLQKAGHISKLKITALRIIDPVIANDRDCLFNINSKKKYCPDEFGYSDIAFDDANRAEHEYFAQHYKELYMPVFEYLYKINSNTLILFDRIEVGKNLFEYAKELYAGTKNVYYIDGSIDVKYREETRFKFEQDDGNLLIAQASVFSTGLSIKRLTNLVLLTSSKAFSRTIQSIGRTLRLHESKTEAHIIDCSWSYKYSDRHYHERLKIYKQMYDKSQPDEIIKITLQQ